MDDKQIIDMLQKNDLKVTTQRLMISSYVLSRKDHPSADQIYVAIKEQFPTISLGTVYKTLNLLKEIGAVQELGFGEGAVRYDPNTEIHINMICTKCNSISDYYPEDVDGWWNELVSKLDVKPVGQRIDIYRLCEKCRKSEEI